MPVSFYKLSCLPLYFSLINSLCHCKKICEKFSSASAVFFKLWQTRLRQVRVLYFAKESPLLKCYMGTVWSKMKKRYNFGRHNFTLTYLFKKAKLEMFGKIFPNFSKNVDFFIVQPLVTTLFFFSNFSALHCICGRKRPIWQNMYFGKFNRRLVTNGDGKMSTLLALSSKKLPDPICKYL